jgi:integrase
MSYLKQRDGIYRYIYKKTCTDFSLYTKDRDEAEILQFRLDQRAAAGDTKLNKPISFKIAAAIYLQDKSIDQKDKYRMDVMPNLFKDISLVDINKDIIDGYKDLRLSSVSAKTVKNDLDIVSGFMEWCVRKGYIGVNPFKGIRKGIRGARHIEGQHIITSDQANKIWNFEHYLYPWGQAVVRLLILIGATRSELASLSWSKIGDEEITLTNKGIERKIESYEALRKVLNSCARSGEWVFPNAKRPSEHIAEDTLYRAVRYALDNAGAGYLTFSNVAQTPQSIRSELEKML